MALLALVAGAAGFVAKAVTAQAPPPSQGAAQTSSAGSENRDSTTKTPDAKLTSPIIPTVQLNLVIAGLNRGGCDVEVKPGNPSCRFKAVDDKGSAGRHHVGSDGFSTLQLRDVELRGADRTCIVAITVREPGQSPKTVYRGFRLPQRSSKGGAASSSASAAAPVITCYLSSPSKLARADDSRPRK
jgi:hypothetical protein